MYVDESGDHGPVSAEYPVFVLAFCIFEKGEYVERVARQMQGMKFRHFGHDAVVFHEREIRKATKPFERLQEPVFRARFFADLEDLIANSPFRLVACAVRKDRTNTAPGPLDNPYHAAMRIGIERVALHLRTLRMEGRLHLIFESRGRSEDRELQKAFEQACLPTGNSLGESLDMSLVLASKHGNHTGMQIADLLARPIGRHVLQPHQPNRAWEILKQKFVTGPEGQVEGYGLSIDP